MDYGSNSKKEKIEAETKPEKKLGRVVTGEVLIKKKGVGSKFKDLFIMADARSVMSYVVAEVLLPAARNMVVDGASEAVKRMMYGNQAMRGRGQGTRVTYNNYSNPINRGYRDVTSRQAPTPTTSPRTQRAIREDFILSTREEAETVLERMNDCIDSYEIVSVADFNELVGYPSSHVDNKWGWSYLGDVQIRQIREGYLLDLPPAEPIS